jgi:hypothetical protein
MVLYGRALLHKRWARPSPAEADLAAAITAPGRHIRRSLRSGTTPSTWPSTTWPPGAADEAERLYREAIAGGAPVGALREALRDLDDFLSLFPAHPQAQAMHDLLAAHLGRSE